MTSLLSKAIEVGYWTSVHIARYCNELTDWCSY